MEKPGKKERSNLISRESRLIMATIISIVSYPFLPARVGGQKGVALFNKYFSRFHRLICVTTKNNDPAAAEGYEVKNILSDTPSRYINLFYFFTLRKIIRENKATHVLLEHPYYGWLGILLKRFCGVKLIVHSHNIEGLRWKTLKKWWWRILWQYERLTHRSADLNFFIHDDDREYAINHFGLRAEACITMTYGIEWNSAPSKQETTAAKQTLQHLLEIDMGDTLLLFNGAFNYAPNLDALHTILDRIHPLLEQHKDFHYTLIICGRDIPPSISEKKYAHVIIAGFVDDIGMYFKGADVFINPINEGGGIKTKLVEALGYNLNAVSTVPGAVGVKPEWCNGKLLISPGSDWNTFVEQIIQAAGIHADIPSLYFDHFYWGYTTKRAAEAVGDDS